MVVVDAIKSGKKPFVFKKIKPVEDSSFTTHYLSPETLIYLSQALYEKCPEGWFLGIRGYRFSLGEKLSSKARENFEAACKFFIEFLEKAVTSGLASAIIELQAETSSRGKSHGAKEKGTSRS